MVARPTGRFPLAHAKSMLGRSKSTSSHATKVYRGVNEVQRFTGGILLFTLGDVSGPFIYGLDTPLIAAYTQSDWQGESDLVNPRAMSGLVNLDAFVFHKPSAREAQRLIPAQVRFLTGLSDPGETQQSFSHVPGELAGVTYLRRIWWNPDDNGWDALYSAAFAVGRYVNALHFLIYVSGNHDTVFGVAGINRFITMLAYRERQHP